VAPQLPGHDDGQRCSQQFGHCSPQAHLGGLSPPLSPPSLPSIHSQTLPLLPQCLSEADQQKFDSIQTFFSPYHNYQAYRQKLRNGIPPIIPLMVLLLQDLTFIDENEDKVHRLAFYRLSQVLSSRWPGHQLCLPWRG